MLPQKVAILLPLLLQAGCVAEVLQRCRECSWELLPTDFCKSHVARVGGAVWGNEESNYSHREPCFLLSHCAVV